MRMQMDEHELVQSVCNFLLSNASICPYDIITSAIIRSVCLIVHLQFRNQRLPMPIFEYQCNTCQHPFEELILTLSSQNSIVCPFCRSTQVTKKLSTFSSKIIGNTKSKSFSQASDCSNSTT